MGEIETKEEAREEAEITCTGGVYIASLDVPELPLLGVQSTLSEAHARKKIAKRWEEYTEESDDYSDILLGTYGDYQDPRDRVALSGDPILEKLEDD